MTETESYKHQYYNKHHENWHLYHFDRALKSFSFHLDRYLESLELKKRKGWASKISKFKELNIKPIISFMKTIWKEIKGIMRIIKNIIRKIRMKLIGKKYKMCILFYIEKGFAFEEILNEMLNC